MKKARIKSVWDMDVFKLAHELTLKIYKITSKFPKIEIYEYEKRFTNTFFQIRKETV